MNYSLGNHDFKSIITEGQYVDKTNIIDEIIDFGNLHSPVITVRPRRFGKSLMISMLKSFFDIEEDNKKYFEHLNIAKSPNYKYINTFPVIALSFKNTQPSSKDVLLSSLRDILSVELEKYNDIALTFLDAAELYKYNAIINGDYSDEILSSALFLLTKLAYHKHDKEVLVLIDEYDLPLFNAYIKGFMEEISPFFKSFYSFALKGNNYVRLAFLTGVMNNAKDSLSDGLNNVMLDNGVYLAFKDEYFGFNEEEVQHLLTLARAKSDISKIREWYGTYEFANKEVFNPWSVLNFLSSNERFLVYWASTGSSAMIRDILNKNPYFDEVTLSMLLNGGRIEMTSDFSFSFLDINHSKQGALVELVSLGYLTAHYDERTMRIYARIPNIEIKQVFNNEINERYIQPKGIERTLADFRDGLLSGDAKLVESNIQSLISSLSYYSLQDWRNYQVLVLTLTATLFQDYYVKEEVPVGEGRCDILLLPKVPGKVGCIIEVKSLKTKTSLVRLKQSAESAIKQMEDSNYVEALKEASCSKIYLYGVSFHKKSVAVSYKLV